MMRLVRLLLYACGCYLYFRIGYPDEGPGGFYHTLTVPLLVGGSLGVFALLKAIDLGTRAAALAIELAFAAGVFLYLGFTLPQANGVSPLSKLASGQRPTQAAARAGIGRLGLDPDSGAAQAVVSLFPKR
ncbi:MAG: hypothetical protein HY554_11250 [Elusimicrobia bacterium]|nr:hypothetical protein [Elusimicrobiota bacterium]